MSTKESSASKMNNKHPIDQEYLDFYNNNPNIYDKIFETVKVSTIGISLIDLSYQLDIPEKILLQCFQVIFNGWNTFFSMGRIIYIKCKSKYFYLDSTDPRSREKNPKIYTY
jgi:hypothetical protein